MALKLDQAIRALHRGKPVVLKDGNIQKASFKSRICRFFNPRLANRQNCEVAEFLLKNLKAPTSSKQLKTLKGKPLDQSTLKKVSNLFLERVLNRRCYPFKSKAVRKAASELTQELKTQLIAEKLDLPVDALRQHPDFVKFALTNRFHRRIDADYQKQGLGVRYNQQKDRFELPVKRPHGPSWISWQKFPKTSNSVIKGYDLFAHGWEKHDRNWTELKPFKILKAEDCKYGAKTPVMELVATYPNRKKPAVNGHVYINYYIPNKDGDVKVYSVEYDFKNITQPDILEFNEKKRVTVAHPMTTSQWKEDKRLIEQLQLTHTQKRKNHRFTHPDKKVEQFYRDHLNKSCGNFAVALYERRAGTKYKLQSTRIPFMTLLFPRFIHRPLDWLENKLPYRVRHIFDKIKIGTRGVMPWLLIQKMKAMPQFPFESA